MFVLVPGEGGRSAAELGSSQNRIMYGRGQSGEVITSKLKERIMNSKVSSNPQHGSIWTLVTV